MKTILSVIKKIKVVIRKKKFQTLDDTTDWFIFIPQIFSGGLY